MDNRKLTKSSTDKRFFGVAGGLAEYFDVDSTLVRLAFVIGTLIGGPGVIIYLILALVLPSEESAYQVDKIKNDFS